MKNIDVVQCFINGHNARCNNLTSENGKLYSYSTVIAVNHGDIIDVSKNTYSHTTACHIGLVKRNKFSYQKINIIDMDRYGRKLK